MGPGPVLKGNCHSHKAAFCHLRKGLGIARSLDISKRSLKSRFPCPFSQVFKIWIAVPVSKPTLQICSPALASNHQLTSSRVGGGGVPGHHHQDTQAATGGDPTASLGTSPHRGKGLPFQRSPALCPYQLLFIMGCGCQGDENAVELEKHTPLPKSPVLWGRAASRGQGRRVNILQAPRLPPS